MEEFLRENSLVKEKQKKEENEKVEKRDRQVKHRAQNKVRVMGDSMIRFSGDNCKKAGALVECFPGIKTEQMEKRIESLDGKREEEVVVIQHRNE